MSIKKNHIRFVIQLIGVLIIASLAVTGAAVPSLSNSGGGSWQYQKDITISNTGGALSDYQVLVSLTSGDFPTNAQNNGADIRFTDVSGAELSYWIESWDYSGRNAKIWVKVTSIASGSTTIRMYYGNPSAGSSSNGVGTFMLFDDFSGASVNSGLWTTEVVNSASLSQSGGELAMTVGATQQGNRAHIKSNSNFAVPYRLRFKAKLSGYGDHFTHSYDGTTDATWSPPHVQAGQNFIMYFLDRGGDPDSAYNQANSIGTSTYITTGTANVYSIFEILATTSAVKYVVDDTLKATHTTNIPTIALPLYFRLVTEGGAPWTPSGATQWMDYVFLAKYASSEPSVSVGAETSTSTPTPPPTPTAQCPPAGTYLVCKYIDQNGYIEMYSLNVNNYVDKIEIAGEVKTQWSSDGFGFRIEADGQELKSFRNTGAFTLSQVVSVNKQVGVLKVYGYTEGYAPKNDKGIPHGGWVTSTHVLTKLAVSTTPPPTLLPDFVVTNIRWDVFKATEMKDRVFLYITVKNQGNAAAISAFKVDTFVDNYPLKDETSSLGVGETYEKRYDLLLDKGEHTVEVWVDSSNSIDESNEQNNMKRQVFSTMPITPTPTPTTPTPTPTVTPTSTQLLIKTGTILISSSPVDADIYLDDEYWGATPQEIDVQPGYHIVRLEALGYATKIYPVNLKAGEKIEVSVSLVSTTTEVPMLTPKVLIPSVEGPFDEKDNKMKDVHVGDDITLKFLFTNPKGSGKFVYLARNNFNISIIPEESVNAVEIKFKEENIFKRIGKFVEVVIQLSTDSILIAPGQTFEVKVGMTMPFDPQEEFDVATSFSYRYVNADNQQQANQEAALQNFNTDEAIAWTKINVKEPEPKLFDRVIGIFKKLFGW